MPHLAVTGTVVLALLSVGLLIYFIHHASTSLQADRVVAAVATDLDDAIEALFPERLGREHPADRPPALPRDGDDGAPVTARGHGYVTGVDSDALMKAAGEADVLIRLLRRPGEFVIAGVRAASRASATYRSRTSTTSAAVIGRGEKQAQPSRGDAEQDLGGDQ